ncbi:MAG: hypothetical protein ACRC2Y_07060 [Aeromonas veronii]
MGDKQTVKFGDICREVKLTTKDPIADGYERYIGLEHLDSGSLKIKRWGVIAEDNPSFTRVFKKGHILFGKRRPYLKKAAIAEFDGICSGDIIVMEPSPENPSPNHLPFLVQSDLFWEWAIKTSSGSLSPRTKFKSLAELTIEKFCPTRFNDLAEIGHSILEVEQLSNILTESISTFIDSLLAKVLTRGEVILKPLSSLVDLQVGYAFKSKDFKSEGIALMRGANVGVSAPDWENGKMYLSKSQSKDYMEYLLAEGDIIIAMDRPFTGAGFKVSRIAKTDIPSLLVQRVGRFRSFNGITDDYLWILLNSRFVKGYLYSQQKGMDIPHLSRTEILSCQVPVISEADQLSLSSSVRALLELQRQLSAKQKHLTNVSHKMSGY